MYIESMEQELKKAKEHFKKTKGSEGYTYYRELMKQYSDNGLPFRDYALARLIVCDDEEEAVDILMYALILTPNDLVGLLALAEHYWMGYGPNVPGADEVILEKILHLAPNNRHVKRNIWTHRALFLKGEAQLHAYLQAAQADPSGLETHYNVGLAYWERNDFVHAQQHLMVAEQKAKEIQSPQLQLVVSDLEKVDRKEAWTSGSSMVISILTDWYRDEIDDL